MRIIILGSSGMLGRYLYTYFKYNKYDVIGLKRSDIDLCNTTIVDLVNFFEKFKCENDDVVLINAVGIVWQSGEKNENRYLSVNSSLPHNISIMCKYFKWDFIHPSTDCIFDGKGEGLYKEDFEYNETGIYGLSKALGEVQYGTVIRVSIIGEELYNKYSFLEWVKSQKKKIIDGYVNHYWNGITCLQYAKILEEIINKKLFWQGVRHIYSPTSVTKYELASIINNIYNLNITIRDTNAPIKCDKTLSSNFEQPFDIPEIEVQIKELIQYSDILRNINF